MISLNYVGTCFYVYFRSCCCCRERDLRVNWNNFEICMAALTISLLYRHCNVQLCSNFWIGEHGPKWWYIRLCWGSWVRWLRRPPGAVNNPVNLWGHRLRPFQAKSLTVRIHGYGRSVQRNRWLCDFVGTPMQQRRLKHLLPHGVVGKWAEGRSDETAELTNSWLDGLRAVCTDGGERERCRKRP